MVTDISATGRKSTIHVAEIPNTVGALSNVRVAPEPGIGTGTTSVPRYAHAKNKKGDLYINRKGDL